MTPLTPNSSGRPADPSQPGEQLVVLSPPSRDRLERLFQENEWVYFIDSDGDLGGIWDDVVFHFMLRGKDGEILHINAGFPVKIPFEKLEAVREAVTARNRDKLWPSCSYRVLDDGRLRVTTEYTVDLEHGVTDDQLLGHVKCALETSLAFFREIHESFISWS